MGFLDIDWAHKGPGGDPFHPGQRRGLGIAVSPDGIHWTRVENWATEAICDGATHWTWDPARQKYVLYGRTRKWRPEVREAWSKHAWFKDWFSGRAVARVESADFMNWDFKDPATAPVVLTADLEDKPGTEIYSMKVFPYEGIYIGLVQVFHATPDDATLDVQLAVSRDGHHFTRVGDRSPFIPLGGVGAWNRFNHSLANNDPIPVGDELRIYYGGRCYRHDPYKGPDKGPNHAGIGVATILRDRFVALEASWDGGEVVTRPVVLKTPRIRVNAAARFGEIRVDVLDPAGKGARQFEARRPRGRPRPARGIRRRRHQRGRQARGAAVPIKERPPVLRMGVSQHTPGTRTHRPRPHTNSRSSRMSFTPSVDGTKPLSPSSSALRSSTSADVSSGSKSSLPASPNNWSFTSPGSSVRRSCP